MKKILMLFAAVLLTLSANAQFESGKTYVGASLSGLDLNYNGNNEVGFGVNALAGKFVADDFLLYGFAGFEHPGKDQDNTFSAGIGGRYYIEQNGLFLGVNAKYIHANSSYNDFMPGVEVGYAFFISHTVTIEPAVYYQQSFKDHSDYSTVGLKVGFGIYLGKD